MTGKKDFSQSVEQQVAKNWKVSFILPVDQEEQTEAFLFQNVPWGWEEGEEAEGRRYQVYFTEERQTRVFFAALRCVWPSLKADISCVEQTDWASAWKEFFTPIPVGNTFEIRPSWLEGRSRLEPLIIEPKMAFGTGHHATTFLCLQALCELMQAGKLKPGARFLDLGTGTGILSIACARFGLRGLGVDIDPVALDNARENLCLNQVQGAVELREGSVTEVADMHPFDLIVANILSGPLILMAQDIMKRLAPGGILVLSGLLTEQEKQVKNAYIELGSPRHERMDDWSVLIWGV